MALSSISRTGGVGGVAMGDALEELGLNGKKEKI